MTMKTYENHINYPDKYYDYLYDLRDTLPKKSMIDLGTAMINKRKHKKK